MTQPLAPPEPHPAVLFADWAKGVDQQNVIPDLKLDTLSADVREIRNKVDGVQRSLDDFIILVAGKFDNVDGRFVQVDGRFTQLEERFAQVDARFAQVDGRFAQVDGRFAQVDGRFAQLEERFSRVEARLDQLDERLGAVQSDIREMKTILLALLAEKPAG